MPLKTGLDFLRELKERRMDLPFVLFTGKGREEVIVEALNLGADGYINKNGSPEAVYCEMADSISKTVERNKAKRMLIDSEAKYRLVVEESLQGIMIAQGMPTRIVFANAAMSRILGYSVEEFESLSPQEVMNLAYVENRESFFNRFRDRLMGKQREASYDFRAVRKDGSIVWMRASSSLIHFNGQPAIQAFFLEIDERKKAEDTLRESEARYRELANSMPNIVYESDITGKVDYINERALEIAGISKVDFEKGLSATQFLVPEDRKRAAENIQRLLAGGNYVPTEYTFLRKDGTTFPALIATSLRFSKDKVSGLRGLVIDITEHKKVQEVLIKSEERYRDLVNLLPETVFETDLTGKIIFFSKRAFEITGFTQEELEKGLNLLSFVVPSERERAQENVQKAINGEDHGTDSGASEYTLLKKNGETYTAIVKTSPIFYQGKVAGLRGLVIDITERKKVEEALRSSQKKYLAYVENSPVAIMVGSSDGKLEEVNEEACKLLGYSRKELMEKSLAELVFEEDLSIAFQQLSLLQTNGKSQLEFRLKKKDGQPVVVFVNAVKLPDGKLMSFNANISEQKKAEAELRQKYSLLEMVSESMNCGLAIVNRDYRFVWANQLLRSSGAVEGRKCFEVFGKTGKICSHCGVRRVFDEGSQFDRYEFVTKDAEGKELWIEQLVTPIRDENGKVTAALELGVPINERKSGEKALRRTVDKLVLANEKLNVVGKLTRHDVRNRLSVIAGNTYLLKKKHQDQADIVDGLLEIEEAVRGSARI